MSNGSEEDKKNIQVTVKIPLTVAVSMYANEIYPIKLDQSLIAAVSAS